MIMIDNGKVSLTFNGKASKPDEALKISEDSKTRCYKGQKNALGLMPGPNECGGTCPWATTGPGGCWNIPEGKKLHTCYVAHCLARRQNVKTALEYNTTLMRGGCNNGVHPTTYLLNSFAAFQKKELKRKDSQLYFRLHWSGDIFGPDYAHSLVEAMGQYPQINFWMYTRSFPYVHLFESVKNLSLYLSLDKQNFLDGLKTYSQFKWPNLKICYLSPVDDWNEQFQKVKDSMGLDDIRVTSCPVDTGKMALEESCIKCRMCLLNAHKIHIWFKTK